MKVAMVTGPSSGIGLATATKLAALGYHVVAAGRSESKVRSVVDAINGTGGSAEYVHLDLTSLRSARRATEALEGRELDVLVNNAGVGVTRGLTADGFEVHFAVNHLGHFMLTHHLNGSFRSGTRIIQVSSAYHFAAEGIDFARQRQPTRSLFGVGEYATSKLANVLFVRELARRRPELRAYAVHPGMVDTKIFPAYVRPFIRGGLLTPEQGAETIVWCATSPEAADQSGLYYHNKAVTAPSAYAQDDELAAALWEWSERWCGITPGPGRR